MQSLSAIPLALLLALAATACGVDSTGPSGSNGSAPAPGPQADGWITEFVKGGQVFSCEDTPPDSAPSVTVGSTTIFVGFEQIGDNQNPLVVRYDDGQPIYCARHETEGPDGRAVGLTWDGGDHLYVTYTIVGGGSSLEGKGGWLPGYAPGAISGGGPKVSYVGRVSANDGALQSGTFIISVKSDNKVNSHTPRGAATVLDSGEIEFLGESAHKPIDPSGDRSMECTDYPFDSRYVLRSDLSEVVCAGSSNCDSSVPCD